MTVGEKIQYYRKKIGLSQEELGQKMLVSRQTVSLWEMDKTMPTVDNLLRLKEIFSVSIDDILSEIEPIEENNNSPKEAYIFKYEKSDLKEVFKKTRFPLIKNTIVFTIACIVLFIFFAMVEANDMITGLLLGYTLLGIISHIKGYFVYRKAWKNSENKILQCTYSYEIFDEYFMLNISRNDEITRTQKIYFDDIEKIQTFGNYLILQITGQIYIIKKDALISESEFISFCKNTPNKVEMRKPKDKLKTISLLLFVLSICTIWGALIGVATLNGINQAMTENMWVFFVFLPIPIASIVFGFYLKKKGYKYKKNVIVGIIMATLLFIYGSFTFIFSNLYSHSDEPILNAEQVLNIDIRVSTHRIGRKERNLFLADIYIIQAIFSLTMLLWKILRKISRVIQSGYLIFQTIWLVLLRIYVISKQVITISYITKIQKSSTNCRVKVERMCLSMFFTTPKAIL